MTKITGHALNATGRTNRLIVRRSQNGVALLIVLIFSLALSAALLGYLQFSNAARLTKDARIIADEAVQLSKAARIFVRDVTANDLNLKNALSATPQLISIDELIARRLLPHDFGEKVGPTGTMPAYYRNHFGQPLFVFMANNPVNGLPSDPNTIPTAYVLLGKTNRQNLSITEQERVIALAAQRMKELSLPVNAPIFQEISATQPAQLMLACGGGTVTPNSFVGSWDTGCLSLAHYNTLRNSVALNLRSLLPNLATESFQGAMAIPAWRAYTADSRVLSRFAQPENPGATTMATGLIMASAASAGSNPCPATSGNLQGITIQGATNQNDGTLTVSTQDFDTDSSQAGTQGIGKCGTNTRYDISNVGSMNIRTLIAEPTSSSPTDANGQFMAAKLTGGINVSNGHAILNKTNNLGANKQPLTLGAATSTTINNNMLITNPDAANALVVSGTTNILGINTDAFGDNGTLKATNAGSNVGVTGNTNFQGQVVAGANTQIIAKTVSFAGNSGAVTATTANFGSLTSASSASKPKVTVTGSNTGAGWGNATLNAPVLISGLSGQSSATVTNDTKVLGSGQGKGRVEVVSGACTGNNCPYIGRINVEICASYLGGQCPSRP